MIYILGRNGMLGSYIYDYLKKNNYNIIGLTRNDFDVLDIINIRNNLNFFKEEDIIINCIGLTNKLININNESIKNMYIINSIFPHILNDICNNTKSKLFHISTDCVFTGLNKKCNKEYIYNSIPDEKHDYGYSKSLGDLNLDCAIIRCSIIGEEINLNQSTDSKFIKNPGFIEWLKNNKNNTINGYKNHLWNGMTCLEYAKLIEKIINEKIYWKGVRVYYSEYNGCNKISKYDLTHIVNDIYDLNLNIIPINIDNIIIDKTMYGEKIEKDLYDQVVELKNYKFNSINL